MDTMETPLHALKGTPSPQFSEALRARLRAGDRTAGSSSSPWRIRKALVPATVALLLIVLFSVPAVRASAAALLAHFRVVNFVALRVDPNRFDALGTQQLDLGRLIGEHVQVAQGGGPPVPVSSIDEAAARAGMDVRLPAWLPPGTTVIETAVTSETVVRVTGNATRLRQVLDALGITDLEVPGGIDGQTATVHIPPVVMVRFDHGSRRTRFFQSRPPEMTLPAGIDVKTFGEIGLRILGMSDIEARRFAEVIDWETTLIVPVPPIATNFREIEISGHRGIAVSYQPPNESPTTMIMWATDDRVFGMISIQGVNEVLAMADSVP